jgi:hypothetical protein
MYCSRLLRPRASTMGSASTASRPLMSNTTWKPLPLSLRFTSSKSCEAKKHRQHVVRLIHRIVFALERLMRWQAACRGASNQEQHIHTVKRAAAATATPKAVIYCLLALPLVPCCFCLVVTFPSPTISQGSMSGSNLTQMPKQSTAGKPPPALITFQEFP